MMDRPRRLGDPAIPDPAGQLRTWAQAFVRSDPTDTLSLLKELNAGVSGCIAYQSREDEGTQSPTQTLDRGLGFCRDFVVLFVEAARSLGFGARSSPAISTIRMRHLDQRARGRPMPGQRSLCPARAGSHSIPRTAVSVASISSPFVARDIRQAMPVASSFFGMTDALQGMSVSSSRHRWAEMHRDPLQQRRGADRRSLQTTALKTFQFRRLKPWPARPRTSLGS